MTGVVPKDWKGERIVPISKEKGDGECANYRRKSILSIPGKKHRSGVD